MAAKGCAGRGGKPNGKKYEGRRHGGGGGGKNGRRKRSAARVEKGFETVERRHAKESIKEAQEEAEFYKLTSDIGVGTQ